MNDVAMPDPLERVVQLRDEIESNRARMQSLAEQLNGQDPKAVVPVLMGELLDTVMSLFSDFAGAVTETMEDDRDYITNELAPAVFEDPDAVDEPDESQLTPEDAVQYTELLTAYATMLHAQYDAATNDELKAEINSWITRVDKQLAYTLEITLEPELPDGVAPNADLEQSNGQSS